MPPGPVELEQNIPGTVTLSWASSPDEKRDDRLHYAVFQRDSFKRTWRTVADNLFNNKFTVVNILPGREYHFRVFAKNDMGLSPPSESPLFETKKEKGRFFLNFNSCEIKGNISGAIEQYAITDFYSSHKNLYQSLLR